MIRTLLPFVLGLILAWPALAKSGVDEALRAQGTQALEAGKADLAVQWFERALVARPIDPRNHADLGLAWRAAGKPERAAKALAAAREIDPILPQALLGEGLLALDRADKASATSRLDLLQRSCATCPETARLDAAVRDFRPPQASETP